MKDTIENIKQNYKEDIENWINGKKVCLSALSLSSFSNEEISNYAKKRYEIDKKNYLSSGIWNKPFFYDRSKLWSYYYWLQLWDKDINLQMYFDYDYDTNIWTREKIQQSLKNYDENYIFQFLLFLHSNLNISFDEYIQVKSQTESQIHPSIEDFLNSKRK